MASTLEGRRRSLHAEGADVELVGHDGAPRKGPGAQVGAGHDGHAAARVAPGRARRGRRVESHHLGAAEAEPLARLRVPADRVLAVAAAAGDGVALVRRPVDAVRGPGEAAPVALAGARIADGVPVEHHQAALLVALVRIPHHLRRLGTGVAGEDDIRPGVVPPGEPLEGRFLPVQPVGAPGVADELRRAVGGAVPRMGLQAEVVHVALVGLHVDRLVEHVIHALPLVPQDVAGADAVLPGPVAEEHRAHGVAQGLVQAAAQVPGVLHHVVVHEHLLDAAHLEGIALP